MNKIVLIGILSILLFYSCEQTKKSHENKENQLQTKKPNIIFIMADDMGYGDLGCYGQKMIKTPNIDKLATEGIKFTQHYAGSTVCAPSRSVLMTGLHTGHTEIRGNRQVKPNGQWPISNETTTVAEYLKKSGYTTALIGKWGLGNEKTTGEPNKQGFDYYYGYLDQVLAHNYFPEYLLRNGKKEFLQNKVKYLDSTAWHKGLGSYTTKKISYSNDLFTTDALQYIEKNKDTTFFLYLPYTIPHDNGEALEDEWQEVPDFGIYKDKNWSTPKKGYAAQITRLDSYVGQLMRKLKETGIDENTIVFFTSDNGPLPENEREYTQFFNSNGPLKGGKRDLYEGGIRIPMLVRWPTKIKPNTITNHSSAFWDFLPTAYAIAGGSEPLKNSDGISFLPTLLNKTQQEHEFLYWEFNKFGKESMQAIRKNNWKAVRNTTFDSPNSIPELYNLATDISEMKNVAEQYPEIVKELSLLMIQARTKSEIFPLYGKD
jgi:arylsulfatase A-like enzyme